MNGAGYRIQKILRRYMVQEIYGSGNIRGKWSRIYTCLLIHVPENLLNTIRCKWLRRYLGRRMSRVPSSIPLPGVALLPPQARGKWFKVFGSGDTSPVNGAGHYKFRDRGDRDIEFRRWGLRRNLGGRMSRVPSSIPLPCLALLPPHLLKRRGVRRGEGCLGMGLG